jgi:hypothetical protein
MGISADFEKQ